MRNWIKYRLTFLKGFELFVWCLFMLFCGISAKAQDHNSGFTFKKHPAVICEGSEFILSTTSGAATDSSVKVFWEVPPGWMINGELSDGLYYEADTNVIIQPGSASGLVSATIYEAGKENISKTISDYITVLSPDDFGIEAPEYVCQNQLVDLSCSGPAKWCGLQNCQLVDSSSTRLTIKPGSDKIKVKAISTELCSFEDSATITVRQVGEILPINSILFEMGVADFEVLGPEKGTYSWYPYPGGRQFENKGSNTPYDSPVYQAYVEDSTTLYSVYTDLFGCSSDTIPVTVLILDDLVLSSAESGHKGIRFSSNPFQYRLQVEFASTGQRLIEVHDVKGKVQESFEGDFSMIQLGGHLLPGTYFLKVFMNNSQETYRIVKI